MRLVWYRGGWYIYLESGKRLSCRTRDRTLAEIALAEYGRRSTEKIETVKQIVDSYLEDRKSKSSHASMGFWWKNAEPHFGKLIPENVTREVCRTYIESRKAAAETIRHEIGIVRSAIKWKLPRCQATFELPPKSPARNNHLTREQFRTLIDACPYKHLKIFLALAISTAGRKTAILDLTWDRVDFERGLITLDTGVDQDKKTRAVVPMTETLRKYLTEARESALSPYVVEYAAGKVGRIDKGFRAAVKAAKLGNITPHDIRRTAAIWMAEARKPMSEISAYLGHSDSRTTEKHYARYSPDFLKDASKALEF